QDDALVVRRLERALERRIPRSGEAHIDDASALAHRPVDAPEDIERGALAGRRGGGKSIHGEEAGARRGAEEPLCEAMAPAMPVPCACGFSGAPSALKRCAITPSKSGCVASISESITAIGTLVPRTMR